MFVLGLEDADFDLAMQQRDFATLNQHLYRVQKIGTKDYSFRYHTETSVDDKYNGQTNLPLSMSLNKLKRVRSFDAYWNLHPHKVKVNILGEITKV